MGRERLRAEGQEETVRAMKACYGVSWGAITLRTQVAMHLTVHQQQASFTTHKSEFIKTDRRKERGRGKGGERGMRRGGRKEEEEKKKVIAYRVNNQMDRLGGMPMPELLLD